MPPASRITCSALLLLASALAVPAQADPPAKAALAPAADRQAAARIKAQEGLEFFNAGRFAEAFERFGEADRLYHAPTLTLYLGHCQRELGRLVAARALYEKVVAE